MCFAHLSSSGGCRVQRPFDSTAQRPYTPDRHASRCDRRAKRDKGFRFSGPRGWQRRWKTMDNPFSKPTVTTIDDDDRCEVDNSKRRGPEGHTPQASLHYELIPPHYKILRLFFFTHHQHVLCPREHRPGHLRLSNVQGLQTFRSEVFSRLPPARS